MGSAESISGKDKLISLISYISTLLALLIYFIVKDNKFVRFHALQALLLDVVLMALALVLVVATVGLGVVVGSNNSLLFVPMVALFLALLIVGLARLYCLWQVLNGNIKKLPFIGNVAEKHS